jgi:hypothetical protein
MTEIKLNNYTSIYKTNISYNKDELLKELYFNDDFNDITSNRDEAGKESTLVITSKHIEYIKSKTVDFISSILYDNRDINYCQKNWIFFNDKNATHVGWHTHENNHASKILKNQWTYSFYVQMPNNLSGDEGKLSFKIDNEEHSILPEEGDIIVFPATLLHKPELCPNSTQPRIVLVGSLMEIDINQILKKKQKTLF